jgi:hypothetical protein
MRAAVRACFIGKECGVNAAVDDPRTLGARFEADFVAAASVAGMDPDTDDVAGGDLRHVDRVERLVDNARIAPSRPGCGRKHVQPPWGDDGNAK